MKYKQLKYCETVCIYQDIKCLKYNILYILIQSIIVTSAYVPQMAERVEELAASGKKTSYLFIKMTLNCSSYVSSTIAFA